VTVAERLAACKARGEAVRVVDEVARAQLRAYKGRLLVEALERWVMAHLGPPWRRRGREPTPWVCRRCGPRDACQVKRNGHYRRCLVVQEGVISLRVPQLCCLGCGGQLALATLLLPRRRRYWLDLDRAITEAYLHGASYRKVRAMVERRIQSGAGLMSLWRRFQEIASKAHSASLPGPLKTLYLDEAYCRVKGEPCWALLALGENQRGQRGFLGALLSSDRSQEAWQKLLESLRPAAGGTGLTVMHDGDGALAAAVALVLPEAQQRLCLWHQLHNLFRQARDRYPGQQERQREMVEAGKQRLLAAAKLQPRTTSPLERAIREYRRRTRSMDGFGSLRGASNFLRAWLVKENSRWAGQDWLETLVA